LTKRPAVVIIGSRVTVPASAEAFTGKPAPTLSAAVARGLLAEPYPLAQVNTSRTLATQALLGVLVPVSFGTTVSGVAVCIETAAAGTLPTNMFVALYDLTGVRLAVSANIDALANWNATGLFSFAFSTAWTVTADGAVYAAILKDGVFGSTEPKIATMTAVTGSGAALGSNAPGAVTQAAQATMPNPATLVANASYPWLALV
jgi:hypothetical protein